MADPLSVASGVAGVVSLGIQICQGLVKCYKAWDGRQEDVDVVVSGLQREKSALTLLQRSLEKQKRSLILTDDVAEAENCIADAKRAFIRLDTILQKCQHSAATGKMKERVKSIGVAALYPFRKDTLKEIQHHVGDIGRILMKTVQILQL